MLFLIEWPKAVATLKADVKHFGIVCGVLACDEVMAAFLDANMADRQVLALSIFADDARYSNVPMKWRKKIRQRFGVQLENILSLKPELVVLSSYSRLDYQEILKKAGIKILHIDAANNINDIQKNILKLGDAVGRRDLASALNLKIEGQRKTLQADCKKPHAQRPSLLHFYPENGSVSGMDSTINELAELACAKNYSIAQKIKGWPKFSLERHLTLKPDYLLISIDKEELQRHNQWSKIPAVKQGRLIEIEDRFLSSQSQHIMQAVPQIKEAIKNNAGKL